MTRPVREDADPHLLLAARDAVLAPSLENSQPWRWVVGPTTLELYVDRTRQLLSIDPAGRGLVVSCGVSLHHALVSLHAHARRPVVQVFPDGEAGDFVARVTLADDGRGVDEVADLMALRSRRTDRRRFTAWPVPRPLVSRLTDRARQQGALVVAVEGAADRARVAGLVQEARRVRATPAPSAVAAPVLPWVEARNPQDAPATIEPSDAVVVLGGLADSPHDWLVTGRGLSALWLRAEREGLAVVPMSEVVEVAVTRGLLRDRVLSSRLEPHLVVRVGWRPLGRVPGARPSRRPVDTVVRVLGPCPS